jgi:hypothetical protein
MAYDSNVQYTPMIQVWMVYATHLWDVIEEKKLESPAKIIVKMV